MRRLLAGSSVRVKVDVMVEGCRLQIVREGQQTAKARSCLGRAVSRARAIIKTLISEHSEAEVMRYSSDKLIKYSTVQLPHQTIEIRWMFQHRGYHS